MKYHVFIGSTLDDLKAERRELPRIVMELGHIPVTADYLDRDQKNAAQLLQKTIEECDYFIALVAHRYSDSEGKSGPLAAEYNAAVKKGVPVIALIIDEKARWKSAKMETGAAQIKKLEDFKMKLSRSSCDTWVNAAELCQKAQNLLIQEMRLNPRGGWVRAGQAVQPEVANELARLSGENDSLRHQVKIENGEFVAKLRERLKHIIKILAMNKVTLSFYYTSGDNWENTREFRYIRILKLLVPELALGKTTAEISRFLGTVLNPDLEKTVRKDYPTPSNTVKKIMTDFSMLRLVRCVNGDDGGSDNEVWEITDYGKELYSAYRMRQLEKALAKKESAGE